MDLVNLITEEVNKKFPKFREPDIERDRSVFLALLILGSYIACYVVFILYLVHTDICLPSY